MASPGDRVETAQSFIEFLKNIPTRKEFVDSFANVVKSAKAFENRITAEFQNLKDALLSKVDAKLATVRDGIDGKDGSDGPQGPRGERGEKGDTGESIVGPPGKDGKDGSPDTGDEIIDKINAAEKLIAKEAVLGLDAIEEQLKVLEARPIGGKGGGNPQGIQLLVGGSKKGRALYLNLIGGTGISLSYSYASGRNDITVSATGSASLTPITVTGTINDSNKNFTAASTPNIVIVNGAAYRDGKGCTISGTSITLDNPPGVGGDVYCL